MRRINIILGALAVALLGGLAFAQTPAGFNFDLASWAAAPAALAAAFIIPAMAFIRKHLLKLEGWEVVVGDMLLGVIGSGVIVYIVHVAAWQPLGTLAFGVSAGLYAAGGYEAIRGLIRPALPKGVNDGAGGGAGEASPPATP